jgi:hypothetical protein
MEHPHLFLSLLLGLVVEQKTDLTQKLPATVTSDSQIIRATIQIRIS